ncbi:MAG: UDP-N-acetylmuramoyl-tripeptide--D-alanyl-D-alanine ligase [Candidatus Aminicenantes bacterium]|nr:MAG: UDP-N-acetylmuramoyl-tripeptide--D-alanyl-D-alanine ligase [Candidatus Aminicenantes bacterium]
MVELNLNEIAKKTGGDILQGLPSISFRTFNIDSRISQPGELFFALVAQRDGHTYIADAAQKGAAGAVISRPITPPNPDMALIQVPDTLFALQNLAEKVLDDHSVKVVGITGSIGKTTTKEFAATLLARRFEVLKSEGNYNNHIGLPLSILRLQRKDEVTVLEMGMRSAGEITRLTQIAPPDIAVITNIHPVHLEFFHSLEEIAQAKKEILDGMKTNGTAVLNGDDPAVQKIARDWRGTKLLFGFSEGCDVRAENIQRSGYQGITFDFIYGGKRGKATIPFITTSFLSNFLAASAIAYALSTPFDDMLAQTQTLKPFPMRGEVFHLPNNIVLIDDSYNSNPAALESILKDLSQLETNRKVAILGDMLELGETQIAYHHEAGEQVQRYAWDLLITIGTLSHHMAEGALEAGMNRARVASFENADQAADHVMSFLEPGDLVLVKGSRGIRTDKIVESLKNRSN